MGWPAWVYGLGGHGHGLGLRYRHLSATCACTLGGSGSMGFFRMHIVNLCPPLPKKVDCSQIASHSQCIWLSWLPFSRHFSCIFSILITATSESHCLSQFLEHHRPPSQRLQIPIITIIIREGSGPPHYPRVVAWRAGGLDHVDINRHIVSQDSGAQIFHLW